jgi:hypothetical protein
MTDVHECSWHSLELITRLYVHECYPRKMDTLFTEYQYVAMPGEPMVLVIPDNNSFVVLDTRAPDIPARPVLTKSGGQHVYHWSTDARFFFARWRITVGANLPCKSAIRVADENTLHGLLYQLDQECEDASVRAGTHLTRILRAQLIVEQPSPAALQILHTVPDVRRAVQLLRGHGTTQCAALMMLVIYRIAPFDTEQRSESFLRVLAEALNVCPWWPVIDTRVCTTSECMASIVNLVFLTVGAGFHKGRVSQLARMGESRARRTRVTVLHSQSRTCNAVRPVR